MSPSGHKADYSFPDQNKGNVSIQGKVWSDLPGASYRIEGFLTKHSDKDALCVHHTLDCSTVPHKLGGVVQRNILLDVP